MPTYTYRCTECESEFDRVLPLSEYDHPQTCSCGCEDTKRVISPVGFVLRGDGWGGKNLRIKNQMLARRKNLAGKELERKMDGPGVRLAPNVGGVRVDSWAEAQRMAKSLGKDTSSFDDKVRKERQEAR